MRPADTKPHRRVRATRGTSALGLFLLAGALIAIPSACQDDEPAGPNAPAIPPVTTNPQTPRELLRALHQAGRSEDLRSVLELTVLQDEQINLMQESFALVKQTEAKFWQLEQEMIETYGREAVGEVHGPPSGPRPSSVFRVDDAFLARAKINHKGDRAVAGYGRAVVRMVRTPEGWRATLPGIERIETEEHLRMIREKIEQMRQFIRVIERLREKVGQEGVTPDTIRREWEQAIP